VTRVLFISAEPLGETMAGPAIRVLELARAVAAHCEVTVAAPGPSDAGDAPIQVLEAQLSEFEKLLEAVRSHDVVVAQRLPPQLLRNVAKLPVRFVADLYNPQMIEVLEAAGQDGASTSSRRAWRSMLGQCAVADLVICASEKQRDLWLGGMGLAGLIDVDRYRADPTFRNYVDVVPFGLPDREPAPGRPVLKGVWPGIDPDDKVMLWAGGVWRWLDAITPIRAVERLRSGGRRVHLVFLGIGRPQLKGADIPSSADEAVAFAAERGLEGTSVHFNRGWVPYAEREAYLLESDIGVCAHYDHLEARFSFRTRVLDHFWAGLPSVVSGGDAIGDLVDRRGLGRAVAPGDDEDFALACAQLLDDPAAHEAAARRVRELAPTMRWSEVARPLVRFCRELDSRPARSPARSALARATYGQYPDILSDLRERGGLGEVARRVPHHVARMLRHRT
jgi:glycosyltransferase involved in cell wall biosynthesis